MLPRSLTSKWLKQDQIQLILKPIQQLCCFFFTVKPSKQFFYSLLFLLSLMFNQPTKHVCTFVSCFLSEMDPLGPSFPFSLHPTCLVQVITFFLVTCKDFLFILHTPVSFCLKISAQVLVSSEQVFCPMHLENLPVQSTTNF